MAATSFPSILLILALTVATTVVAYSPSPSDEAVVIKKCTEALGPRSRYVKFCAHNFLGHRAAFLATCDRRKTVAVVIKEVHIKAKAVEALEKKIDSDKSLSAKDAQNLKSCWRITNKLVTSIANVFNSNLLKEHSIESNTVLRGLHGQVPQMKQQCNSSAGRQRGVWSELRIKALESLTADMVALAFVDHLHNVCFVKKE